MSRAHLLVAPLALLVLVVGLDAQIPKIDQKSMKSGQKTDPKAETKSEQKAPTLTTAHGVVGKADRESLTVKPRGADGRFEKELVLQVTGTSRVSTLSTRMQAGRQVMVQQDGDAKDLQPDQTVAVIYAQGASGGVLLSAIALPK
jgi:hypothetical protein